MHRLQQRGHSIGWLVFLLLVLSLPTSSSPQQQTNDRARAVANAWLLSNCVVGERTNFEAQLTQFRIELEPFFLSALERGPDKKQLAELQAAAEARYRQ